MITTKINYEQFKKVFMLDRLKSIIKNGECFMLDLKIDTNKVLDILNSPNVKIENNLENQAVETISENISQTKTSVINPEIFEQMELEKKLEKLLNLK
jgi:hypothetical protein